MSYFKFHVGQGVKIADGNEIGKVIGRAEYDYSENGYLIRYVAGDHRAVEAWWTESALAALTPAS